MESRTYTDWGQVRQTLDRVVRATEALQAVDSVNLSVGKLRLQLVPCTRTVRVLTKAETAVLRLPIAVTICEPYPHHDHFIIDGYIIVHNRPLSQPLPADPIHVA